LAIEVLSRVLFVATPVQAPSAAPLFVAYTKGLPNRFLDPKSLPLFASTAAPGSASPTLFKPGAESSHAVSDPTASDQMVSDPTASSSASPASTSAAVGDWAASGAWLVGEVRSIEGPLVVTGEAGHAFTGLLPGAQYWLLSAEPVVNN